MKETIFRPSNHRLKKRRRPIQDFARLADDSTNVTLCNEAIFNLARARGATLFNAKSVCRLIIFIAHMNIFTAIEFEFFYMIDRYTSLGRSIPAILFILFYRLQFKTPTQQIERERRGIVNWKRWQFVAGQSCTKEDRVVLVYKYLSSFRSSPV